MRDGWLSGWREIADYLGKSVSRVKQWNREYHMPIRKIGHIDPKWKYDYRRPIALPSELDIWIIEYDKIKKKKNNCI